MRRKEREIADPEAVDAIINRCDVCRIALADGNLPYIVAMNFGYRRGEPSVIYFHCANSGKKLDIISRNNNTCFQFDTDHNMVSGARACDFTMKYSSVVGFGKITVVNSPAEREDGLNIIMKQYTGSDNHTFNPGTMDRTTILRVDISEITGKSFG
jgi:hypothetical protein